ncbi:MAG: peptidoglycan DD-metalloendopeptidase family protein [Thermodesulfobacteriota bacterium]
MKAITFITITLFVFCALTPVLAKDNLKIRYEQERQKADKVYTQIQEKKKEASRLTEKEQEILSELGRLEDFIDRQNACMEDLTRKLNQKRGYLVQAEQHLKETEEETLRLKEQARHRVVSYYKFGPVGLMNMVFSSHSLPDLLARQEALRFMLRKDGGAISAYQAKLNELSQVRQEMLASNQALQQMKEKVQIEALHLEKLRQERAGLLAAVCQKKRACLQDITELQESAERLNATIRELQRKMEEEVRQRPDTQALRGFAAQKGKLAPPVKGKVIGLFGRVRRSKSGATIVRNGIDIQAPADTEIRSIYTGRVIYLGNLRGYGNIMILDHGDKYYSLYAHASKFFKEVGSLVKKGETIGLVGAVGYLLGECLYFEIRNGGKPENPLSWIDARRLVFD